jgi:glycine cleavage system H protein
VSYPAELKYTKDHEWVKAGAGEAVIGITDYAQAQLGDVVFVELPAVGRTLKQGEVFGTIESVKAVSELYAPVSGEVTAVNDALSSSPESVNKDPHGAAWIIKVKPSNAGELGTLLDSAAYSALVS